MISLVLPIKNGMPHLQHAIAALRRQTFRDFEIVVQDGGSTDSSLECLRSIRDLPALHLSSEPDAGLGQAYNRGIRRCRGDLVCLTAADEVLDDDALEKAACWFQQHPEAVVIYPAIRLTSASGQLDQVFTPPPFDLAAVIRNEMSPTAAGFIHRANIGPELYYDESLETCPDYEFWIRIGVRFGASRIVRMPDAIVTASSGRASMSFRAESFDRFCRDKLSVLYRYLATLPPGQAADELRQSATAGIYTWAAEKLLAIEGASPAFLKWCARAAEIDPRSTRLRALARSSDAFQIGPAGRFEIKASTQPGAPPPAAAPAHGILLLDQIHTKPHWTGACVQTDAARISVSTGAEPWSYAAEIPVHFNDRNGRHSWYWAEFDLEVRSGQVCIGLMAEGELLHQQILTPAQGRRAVPLKLSHRAGSVIIRNGALPEPSTVEIFHAGVRSSPKPVESDARPHANSRTLALDLRWRRPLPDTGEWAAVETRVHWPVAETALIIIDMWDDTWCRATAARTRSLALRLAPFVSQARAAGIQIIHAPSGAMDHYKDYPGHIAMAAVEPAPPPPELLRADPPVPVSPYCSSETGDTYRRVWTSQDPHISIEPEDRISDQGSEIYSFLRARGIRNLLVTGVHANLCVLDRSFGIKQMSRWGIRCALVRDLTDAISNPAEQGLASRDAALDMVIQFIERHWCPTIPAALDLVDPTSDADPPAIYRELELHPIAGVLPRLRIEPHWRGATLDGGILTTPSDQWSYAALIDVTPEIESLHHPYLRLTLCVEHGAIGIAPLDDATGTLPGEQLLSATPEPTRLLFSLSKTSRLVIFRNAAPLATRVHILEATLCTRMTNPVTEPRPQGSGA